MRMVAPWTSRRWLAVPTAALLVVGLTTAIVAQPAKSAERPASGHHAPVPIYLNTHYSFAERAADLVSRMTLEEKIAQLRTNSAPAIPRLGVQQYTYWSEGQHGLNTLGADTNNGGVAGGVHATSFPTNFAATMSWNPSLIYAETTAISDEARGELDKSLWGTGQNNLGPNANDYGSLTYWAPTVNMDRDPRWGRTDEAFGEDPYFAGVMAGAFVDGYQGESITGQPLTPYLKVASTAKHYALNNFENARHTGSSDTTDANIRDYYTAQFRSLTENAHVSGIMTSYNAINGTPAPANTYTANELLQRTYGFNGYTTSDCGAVGDVYSGGSHDWSPPGWTTDGTTWTNTSTGQQVPAAAGGQAYALRAGTQLNCTGAEETTANIEAAIKAGVLSEGVIDTALVHLFTLRMQTGEFDPASRVPWTGITKSAIQSPAHQSLAEQIAAQDLVLLKNDNNVLPADPAKLNNVVIVGDLANTVTLGGYSGEPSLQVNAVQGITAAVHAANPGATVTYDACGTSTTATGAAACSAATMAAAKTADLVIVFVGSDMNIAHEQFDRASLAMPGNYESLIDQVAAVGNPRTALVIQAAGPVDLSDTAKSLPSIIFSGYNGESQGTALADVLFGKVNPSGHLNFTWYASDAQLPPIGNYGLTPSQTGGLGRTYMYFTGTPTYPFGYGLSYSTFSYSPVRVDNTTVSADGRVRVHFTVTNTGSVAGSTVAQLYVAPSFTVSGVELPREKLEGFAKTQVLAPGQSQGITLTVKASDLSMWDESALKEVVYDGPYQFRAGPDSATAASSATVNVTGAITPRVQYVTVQPDQVSLRPGDTLNLAGKNPWIAPDTNAALEQPHAPADNIVEAVNNDQSFVDLSQAHVQYASTNPSVASVSPDGLVTAVAAGATTLRVTVNGVTGTAPLLVKQPLTISAPFVFGPGTSATITTTFPNVGKAPLYNVTMAVSPPSGWTVTATSPSSFGSVPPGQSVQTTWTVSAPAGASSGSSDLTASATFTGPSGRATADAETPVAVPFTSLGSAFDNTGISDDSNPSAGNLDGGGLSYSAQALASAGLTPGATISHDGATITWPNVAAGSPDNVTANGQAIAVPGSGTTLGLVGASVYGASSGTGTIIYTDGSTQQFTVSFSDWWSNNAGGNGDILASAPYINTASGKQTQQVSVYYEPVSLSPGKTVQYIVLPQTTNMHIFAAGYSCCSFTVSAPGLVTPGQAATVQTDLTNGASTPLSNAAVALTVPSGWSATANGPVTSASLAGGASLSTSWTVTPPASAACGAYSLRGTGSGTSVSLTSDTIVNIVCPSLSAAFNNVGVTSDTNTGPGNFDGGGGSYSAEGLASSGLSPGSAVSVGGVTLAWPSAAAGTPDNVVAEGQTIDLTGSGATLAFLGSADYGTASGPGTITYTDGTTQQFTLTFADWYSDAPASGGTLVASAHVNGSGGPGTHVSGVYSATVALQAGRTVASVTLPAVSGGVATGTTAMHVFAMGIG